MTKAVVNSSAMYPVSSASPTSARIRWRRADRDTSAAVRDADEQDVRGEVARLRKASGEDQNSLASEAPRATRSAEKNQRDFPEIILFEVDRPAARAGPERSRRPS